MGFFGKGAECVAKILTTEERENTEERKEIVEARDGDRCSPECGDFSRVRVWKPELVTEPASEAESESEAVAGTRTRTRSRLI